MKAVQIAVTATFIVTGAYVGLCVGQLVSYYAAMWLMREVLDDSATV